MLESCQNFKKRHRALYVPCVMLLFGYYFRIELPSLFYTSSIIFFRKLHPLFFHCKFVTFPFIWRFHIHRNTSLFDNSLSLFDNSLSLWLYLIISYLSLSAITLYPLFIYLYHSFTWIFLRNVSMEYVAIITERRKYEFVLLLESF